MQDVGKLDPELPEKAFGLHILDYVFFAHQAGPGYDDAGDGRSLDAPRQRAHYADRAEHTAFETHVDRNAHRTVEFARQFYLFVHPGLNQRSVALFQRQFGARDREVRSRSVRRAYEQVDGRLGSVMQHTHGQGLSGAINGSVGGANNARLTPADQMLAKVTRIAGVVFFVVAILACLFAGRLAG